MSKRAACDHYAEEENETESENSWDNNGAKKQMRNSQSELTTNCHVLLDRLHDESLLLHNYQTSANNQQFQSDDLVKTEPCDELDPLQMSCETILTSPPYGTLEVTSSPAISVRSMLKSKLKKDTASNANYLPLRNILKSKIQSSNSSPSCGENTPNVTSQNSQFSTSIGSNRNLTTNVTAIMLRSVASVGDNGSGDILKGASAAAELLARHGVHSPAAANIPINLTTVLNQPVQTSSSMMSQNHEKSFEICEDVGQLKKLLVESNNKKQILSKQLFAEQNTSAKLRKRVEMLEAVVTEFKCKLETVDPDGFKKLADGKNRTFYRLLGLLNQGGSN